MNRLNRWWNYFLNNPNGSQYHLSEDRRKAIVFNYFIAAIGLAIIVNICSNIYRAFTLNGQDAQNSAGFVPMNIALLLIFGLLWWLHRRYPKPIRHIFLVVLILGMIFFFEFNQLERIFIALTLPIIMAAFLIKPFYSFVYFGIIAGTYVIRVYNAGYTIANDEFLIINLVSLFVIAVVAWLIAQSLDEALAEATALNVELDHRVQLRTQELAEALDREHTAAIRNKTILESITDGIIVFDTARRVLMSNPAADYMFRRSLKNFNEQGVLSLIKDNQAQTALLAWLRGMPPDNQGSVRFELYGKSFSANVAPVILPQDNDERIEAGNVMVLRDISYQVELEKAKDLFFGAVSHELRTPMSAIKGYTELILDIERENLSADGYEYLQTINASINQLLALANDLIDLSRLETGEIDLFCEWEDITEIINQAVRVVQQEFTARNLSLDIKIADDMPNLFVDKRRLLQVLLNLLSNAYKYTISGGAILSVSQLKDNTVEIKVSDTGIGVKPKDQINLFKRFFRAEDQTVQKAGGTGLGLSISKGLVELHKGELSFESEYGKGTTFTITLPANSASAAVSNS